MTVFSLTLLMLLAAAISYVLTPVTKRLALRVGAVDQPGPRKVHKVPIPRLGGLAVVVSAVIVSGALCFLDAPGIHRLLDPSCAGLGLGLLPILVVSLWDDIHTLPALPKLAAQVAGAGIAVAFGIRLEPQVHLFGHEIALGFLSVPFALLWIVGVTNAFNLVDGLDGLSAGLALISAFSLAFISLLTSRYPMASASLVLAGALVGFLPYNVYPAKVFLGDTGATAVGFWLACLALRGGSTLSAGMAVLIPVVVLGLPVTETLISMLRRFLRRLEHLSPEGLFEADREHIHHRLIALGLSERLVVMALYAVGLVLAACALVSLFMTVQSAALLLVTLLGAAFIGVSRLGYNELALVRRGIVLKFYDVPVLKETLFAVFFDLSMVVVALYGTIVLKYDDWAVAGQRRLALQLLTLLPPVTLVVFWAFRLYLRSWRYASVGDLLRSTSAVVASSGTAFLLCSFTPFDPPVTFFAIYTLLFLALVNGSRASYRILSYWNRRAVSAGEQVLIYGAGQGGAMALREMLSNSAVGLKPIGFIDDDPEKAGKNVNGYPVFGPIRVLEELIPQRKVSGIVVSSGKIARENILQASLICKRTGTWLRQCRIGFKFRVTG